jgi:uncharacterized protein (TIGR02231 family)
MKRLFLFFLPLLCLQLQAKELETPSKITAVTVYRSMARETRSCIATLPAGNNEVIISVKGDAVLLSASVRTNYFQNIVTAELQANPKALKIQDSIAALNLQSRWLSEEQTILSGEMQLVNDLLKAIATTKEFKPSDVTTSADIYRSRFSELKKKLFDIALKKESIQTRLSNHQAQLNEMGPKPKSPVKEIVLNFWSETAGNASIKANYLVQNAGWVPMYDLNVESTSKPVAISYKASIFQTTGYDWKDINLTVSTSTPGMNNDRPILSPRYVDYVAYALTQTFSGNVGAATNSMYIANRNEDAPAVIDPYKYTVGTSESDIHIDYNIEIDQTIPSDGKQHICKLQNYNVPATYRYHTVPKLESAAFLLARITEYGQYNLLAGKANIFFEDTYVGQVDLNPQVTGDTLLVSLGRDEKIVVKRTRVMEKTGKKILSGAQKENFAYEITVRNNKGVPILIEVLDQVPLSRRKEIMVEIEDKSGASYEPTYGRLLWQLKLDPNKSKTLDLIYTVEYPVGKTISEQ